MKVYVLRVDSETKHAGRAARHAAYQEWAPGVINWQCPTCGALDHGVPSGVGFTVSSASHDGLCVLAVTESATRLGVDITPRAAPPGFDEGFPLSWVEREAIGKALGTGIVTGHSESQSWHVTTLVYREFLIGLATEIPHDIELEEV